MADEIPPPHLSEAARHTFSGSSIPPPPEVKIRTMASDLEALARGGGALPQGEIIANPVASRVAGQKLLEEPAGVLQKHARPLIPLLIALGVLGALAVGFFGYRLLAPFFSDLFGRSTPPVELTPESDAPPAEIPFVHQSLFRVPPDRTFVVTFSTRPVGDADELLGYSQRIETLIRGAEKNHTFFEIEFQDDAGEALAFPKFLALIETEVFDPDFLRANFEPDFTAFIFRDADGLWPGYAIRVKRGVAASLLNEELRKFEGSPHLPNLFLASPGTPAGEGFRDLRYETWQVRSADFSLPGAEFTYGWWNSNTLVLSTSFRGLANAFEFFGR